METPKNENRSRDVTTLLSGIVYHPYAGTSYNEPVYQIWSTPIYVHPVGCVAQW